MFQVTTFAGSQAGFNDGPANTAQFNQPSCLVSDNGGNILVMDSGNNKLRRVDWPNGTVSTVAGGGFIAAGDGVGALAALANPHGLIMIDGVIFFADIDSGAIRRIGTLISRWLCVTLKMWCGTLKRLCVTLKMVMWYFEEVVW